MRNEIRVSIPGYLVELSSAEITGLQELMRRFGSARRRAYRLVRKGVAISAIEKILQEDHQLNGRYAKDAYYTIKDLPEFVTFGGKQNQRLREQKKMSREEYQRRRNNLVMSRGEKAKHGNLNARLNLETMTLRVTLPWRPQGTRWLQLNVYIPPKYLRQYQSLLDGSQAYTVTIVRRAPNGQYAVQIAVSVPCEPSPEATRVLALDINAGHTDYAVMDKTKSRILEIGKFNHHETQYARQTRRDHLLYALTQKIGNIAAHYQAEVVVGKLNTGNFRSWNRKANRKIRQMPQYKFRQILSHQLSRRGIAVCEASEAYTSKLGARFSRVFGLDVHKCAAALFALKAVNKAYFWALKAFCYASATEREAFYEGNGSLRALRPWLETSGLTAPVQNGQTPSHPPWGKRVWVMFWIAVKSWLQTRTKHDRDLPAMPGSWGRSFFESLSFSTFAYHSIKVC